MKRVIAILFLFTLVFCNAASAKKEGTLSVNSSDAINAQLYANSEKVTLLQEKAVSCSGYRVQIYSSNLNQAAKVEAFELQKSFSEMYPETNSYVTYSAPFWKLRVGDFTTYFEAYNFSSNVKEMFPEKASEIFVVKEEVKPYYILKQQKTAIEEPSTQIITE